MRVGTKASATKEKPQAPLEISHPVSVERIKVRLWLSFCGNGYGKVKVAGFLHECFSNPIL